MEKLTKIALIAIVIAFLGIGTGFLAYNNGVMAKDPVIPEEEAVATAEEHTGGQMVKVHVEKEGFTSVYEVVIKNETGQWEVEIDGETGKILEIEEDDGPEEKDD